MSKKKKILLICLASMVMFLIFTIAILPVIVRNQAVAAIEKETGRKISIQKVSVNPFTLSVTVRGFSIAATDGGKFVSIGTVHASLGLASIYRRALILSEVSLDAPSIVFSRLATYQLLAKYMDHV